MDPVAVKPSRYGKIICTGYKFKSPAEQKKLQTIFKVFDPIKYSKHEDFQAAWLKDAGDHLVLINKYYKKINEETGYEDKSPTERLMILKSFKKGLNCDGLK